MKNHTKIYMDFFGFKIAEDCICEIPDCQKFAKDINHIKARGMGGNPSGDKDHIENLMAMCREHHLEFGDVREKEQWLIEIHYAFMKRSDNHKEFVCTPENIIDNLYKLGAWSAFYLAEIAIKHYHPEVTEISDMVKLKCDGKENTYWEDWIEKYQKEIGYKGRFHSDYVNER